MQGCGQADDHSEGSERHGTALTACCIDLQPIWNIVHSFHFRAALSRATACKVVLASNRRRLSALDRSGSVERARSIRVAPEYVTGFGADWLGRGIKDIAILLI
jgi:hypothetical protein